MKEIEPKNINNAKEYSSRIFAFQVSTASRIRLNRRFYNVLISAVVSYVKKPCVSFDFLSFNQLIRCGNELVIWNLILMKMLIKIAAGVTRTKDDEN